MSSNLPNWAGADVAYKRASEWTSAVAKKAYDAFVETRKKRSDKFYVPEDVTTMINAMNIGDEEVMKGLNATYSEYWTLGDAAA